MDEVEKIITLTSFGGSKHTTVFFTNGSTACSCGVGYNKPTIRTPPSLREDNV